ASGVTVAIENMPRRAVLGVAVPLYWFNSPAQIVRFKHLTLDTTHIGTWGWNVLDVYEQVKANIAHVHLSNFDGREHRLPTDGQLPLAELLGRLARDRFGGAVSVECHPDAFAAQDEAACREALARTLAFCREHFRVRSNTREAYTE
ncbi:MAG: sugar phosphate isomerase/epimerase, partial [Anaerolineae bacterium]|nr:sugar phosphate isomerase/epimerase [Anaerolineae bacterium]